MMEVICCFVSLFKDIFLYQQHFSIIHGTKLDFVFDFVVLVSCSFRQSLSFLIPKLSFY